MELNNRLSILKDAGQIDEDIYRKVLDIISMFKEKWNIKLTEENGAMLITHLSVALQRIKKGERVDNTDEDMIIQLTNNKYYTKALECVKDIENLINMNITENEKIFIVMHVCVLFENELIKIN